MNSTHFYKELAPFHDFSAVSNEKQFTSLPDDWLIVVADISDSTSAIKQGQLKAVNIIGVAIITAIRNCVSPVEIPYMFGGDGASLCVPQQFRPQVQEALLATQLLASQQFELNLRVGILSLAQIKHAGHTLRVAKYQHSENFLQAAFSGGGMEYAESQLKSGNLKCLNDNSAQANTANYQGLECRWNQVNSLHGETIALIVKALGDSNSTTKLYQMVIDKIRTIYGRDEICRPVHSQGLRMSFDRKILDAEIRIKTQTRKSGSQYFRHIVAKNFIGKIMMTIRLVIGGVHWGNYQRDLIRNTDFKKFDGTLRQVISGTTQQRKELSSFLQSLHEQGNCVYGIHVSDAALITCMIDNREGEHYHFVDSAGGGYAMAAAALKGQLKALNP